MRLWLVVDGWVQFVVHVRMSYERAAITFCVHGLTGFLLSWLLFTAPCYPHRCMFASNFPVDRSNVSFSKLMEVQHTVVSGYTEKEQASYFGGLAKRIYKLE